MLGDLLIDVEEICATKADKRHEAECSFLTRYLLWCSLLGLGLCFSGPLLFCELPLGLGGLLSFFSESFFDSSQSSLQILYSGLCRSSFALFLLECTLLSSFGSTLPLGRVPDRGWFGYFRLCIRLGVCCPAIQVVSFIVNDTL